MFNYALIYEGEKTDLQVGDRVEYDPNIGTVMFTRNGNPIVVDRDNGRSQEKKVLLVMAEPQNSFLGFMKIISALIGVSIVSLDEKDGKWIAVLG